MELELAKARKNSSTSSKPPSSDLVNPPDKKKKKRGRPKKRKQGAQPGHTRKLREPLPPERVDETLEYEIDDSEAKRLGLTPTDEFEIVQHIELLDMPIHVTEYRLRIYKTPEGQTVTPDVPEAKGPIFGPRLLATIGWLKSMGHSFFGKASG